MPTTPPPSMPSHFTQELLPNGNTEDCTVILETIAVAATDDDNKDYDNDDDNNSTDDFTTLTHQKEQLMTRLASKIAVLVGEQAHIAEETVANEVLGVEVARKVTERIRAVDVSKFRSYVDDVGHITMLLLSLSGRLARTENELQIVDVGDSERVRDFLPHFFFIFEIDPSCTFFNTIVLFCYFRLMCPLVQKTLEIKRDRLVEQLDEAKRLKEDIDRRGSSVCRILEQHLSMDAYADYDYFINMKAKLIVDSREVIDKIKVGEDQLAALKETLVQSEC